MDSLAAWLGRALLDAVPAALEGDHIEQSSYAGERTCAVDGAPAVPIAELIEIGTRPGADFSLSADRLDDTTWAGRVEVL